MGVLRSKSAGFGVLPIAGDVDPTVHSLGVGLNFMLNRIMRSNLCEMYCTERHAFFVGFSYTGENMAPSILEKPISSERNI